MSIWSTDDGIYLGYGVEESNWRQNQSLLTSEWKKNNYINVYSESRHIVSFGPNGAGKTRKLLIPNLFRLTNWSTLVIDPKGELAVLTAKHRADNGSEIVTFDPFGVIESRYPDMVKELPYLKSRGFNPVAMLDPNSDDFSDDAKTIGEALIKIDEKDAHWGKSAQALVTGLIMGLRMTLEKDDPKNSIAEIRSLLGFPPTALSEFIESIISNTESEPAIAAKLNRFTELNPENRELFSILSTAVTQTDWIDSKPIKRALSGGTFDFAKMKYRPITVYLILPPRYLETHSTWLRLMITSALMPLIRSTAKGVPVLLMLDEFAQLGRLEVIERNMAIMRGYGIKLWVILQDLSQLQDSYERRWESFIANAGIIQSFAPQDVTTREYLAKLSGKQLLWLNTYSTTINTMPTQYGFPNISTTAGKTHILESVYPDDSLAQMSADQSVLFQAHFSPRRTLLPDPSKLQAFDTLGILSQANAFAAQYDVDEEMKS